MQIVDDRILLFRTKNPEKYRLIPKHQIVGEPAPGIYEIAVAWALDEVRVLRNLGVKRAPSPIQGRYKWPGRHKPFQHQIATASFLTLHNRAYVFNEPGTGKTSSCLWAADYLMFQKRVRRCLIICPLSIMEAAWMKDIMTFVIHRTAAIAHASSMERRIDIIESGTEFVITNFDGVEGIAGAIKDDGTFDLVIIDEANYVKNSTTQRWKAINSILTPDTLVWALTGTPAPQGPMDAYGLAKLVTPHTVPRFRSAWQDATMRKLTQFKWVAKPDAGDKVHAALQPAIRFTKEMCLDLPEVLTVTRKVPLTPQQEKYYRIMKTRAVMEAAGETITAPNAAAVLTKLLQISCIEYNTPVLTDAGWLPLASVSSKNKVWDGEEWVAHDGPVFKGVKEVVSLNGVRMTPDHRVLTISGWATAKECLDGKSSKRFDRASVRLPDSYSSGRHDARNFDAMCAVGMPLRVWNNCCSSKPVSSHQTPTAPEKLWLPHGQRNTQNVLHTPVQNLDQYAPKVPRPTGQRLRKLRRTWDSCLRNVEEFFRELLGRHARGLQRFFNAWAPRQQRRLFAAELQMGDGQGAIQQHANKHLFGNAQGENDNAAGGGTVRNKTSNPAPKIAQRVASSSSAYRTSEPRTPVYDLLNCGPRNRFVVQGTNGELLIVHNCGAAYTDTGETIVFDCAPRFKVLKEVLEETDRKVLVFAPYRHSIDTIAEMLKSEGVAAETITGDVSATRRGEIFNEFQTKPSPRVLVIQPQAASHGVTLTEADTVIFWGPVMSVETYLQCIARAHRIGQKGKNVTVVHLQGSEIEAKMFKQLESRVEDHSAIMRIYDEEMLTQGVK